MNSWNSCETLWDLLSAYADGLATPAESAAVESHIAACTDCARDLQFMRETARVLALTPEVAPPAGLQQAILAATIYRPTWRHRAAAAVRNIIPAQPVRGLAFAGSLAALVLAGYLSFAHRPQLTVPPPAENRNAGTPALAAPNKEVAKAEPVVRPKANVERVGPESAPSLPAKRFDVATRTSEAQTRAAEHGFIAPAVHKTDFQSRSAIRYAAAVPPIRRTALKPHTNVADAIAPPMLQPERPAQPDDMQITTADMRTPMASPMASHSDMDPKSPMGTGTKDTDAVAAAPSSKSRFALAVQTDSAPSGALVSLAELRRQLRKQNETMQVIHPELHLRGRRDMLDVVKSSF